MDDLISRQAAIDAVMQYCPDDDGSCSKADRDIRELLDDIENLPSAQPNLDRARVSDLMEKIYSIQSPHLSTEGVIAKKYYCEQLWMELFGSEDVPTWID